MSQLPNIQENNEQILNDIQSLQQIEQQLFNSLENANISSKDKQKIIEKMNQISNMRINLYKTLSGVNNYYTGALSSSIGTLKEQTAAIAIVENELNQSKKNLELLESEKNNKIRLVEINNYYGEKYEEHANLMKIIINTLIPIIILAFLNNKGILPNILYYILVVIIAFIGGIYFWYFYGSIITRDNINYDEYEWYFDATKAPKAPKTASTDPWVTATLPGTCIGQYCCSDGQIWNSSLNQCIGTSKVVIPTPKKPTKETFVNNILTKTSGTYKTDIDLNPAVPSSSKSFLNYHS